MSYLAPGNVQFTYAQLQGLWIKAGGSPQQAALAAAVAMAESGGNSTNTGTNSNGSLDRGLWQINSSHGAKSSYDIMTNARAAVEISCNGKCTNSCSLSGFTGWGNWTTYCSGAYLQYYKGNVPPDNNVPHNGTQAAANQPQSTSIPATTESDILCGFWGISIAPGFCAGEKGAQTAGGKVAIGIINTVIGSVLNPFITVVAGILGMTGGAILMAGGIFMIVNQTETGHAAIGAGEKLGMAAVAPEAAAAGAAGGAGGAGGRAAAQGQRRQGFGPPSQEERMRNTQSQAASNELRRRQAAQAKTMSTEQLLEMEARRYQ